MIAGNLYRAWMIPKMGYYSRHPEKYSERFRYEYDRYAINLMKKTGRITTEGFGMENLPKDGGYVMFSNHQGKYDALGIMHTHDTPCSVVMDDARSHGPLVKQFIDLVEGKRLKLDNKLYRQTPLKAEHDIKVVTPGYIRKILIRMLCVIPL